MMDELDASFLDDPVMADVAFKEAPEIVTGSRDGKKHLTLNWMQRKCRVYFHTVYLIVLYNLLSNLYYHRQQF